MNTAQPIEACTAVAIDQPRYEVYRQNRAGNFVRPFKSSRPLDRAQVFARQLGEPLAVRREFQNFSASLRALAAEELRELAQLPTVLALTRGIARRRMSDAAGVAHTSMRTFRRSSESPRSEKIGSNMEVRLSLHCQAAGSRLQAIRADTAS